jgi:hypothetical protein
VRDSLQARRGVGAARHQAVGAGKADVEDRALALSEVDGAVGADGRRPLGGHALGHGAGLERVERVRPACPAVGAHESPGLDAGARWECDFGLAVGGLEDDDHLAILRIPVEAVGGGEAGAEEVAVAVDARQLQARVQRVRATGITFSHRHVAHG